MSLSIKSRQLEVIHNHCWYQSVTHERQNSFILQIEMIGKLLRIRERILQQEANMTWMSRENSAQQKVYICTK